MLDGIDLKGRTNVVALGITTDGVTLPLGLWEGSSEHAAVATALLARSSRNVKRRQNGDMTLRWTAAGMLEAEQQFRRIIGHADLAKLAIAVERDIARHRQADTHNATEDAVTLVA
jgi:hypothetical protein